MSKSFFEISSPIDLLSKAKRDYEKMKDDISTDTIFNFFVTTYHIMDYIKALGTVSKSAIKQQYDDLDFKVCQFLCNKGKHIKLRSGDFFEAKHEPEIQGGTLGGFILGHDKLGASERFVVIDGTQEIDVIELGGNLIRKWEQFFLDNGIT